MKMEPSKLNKVAKIIAEDMVELALKGEFDASHFPLPADVVIDALPPESLVKIIGTLRNLPTSSIPLGWTMLFLMPRKIPMKVGGKVFKETVAKLLRIRKDFSQRTSTELVCFPYSIPDNGEKISPSGYRKLVFLLDNLNELGVPIYRGWGFDAFSFKGQFYRVYNLGTLESPKFVFLWGRLLNAPKANVFGHIKVAERVENCKVLGINEEEVRKILGREINLAKNLGTPEEKLEYVVKRWEEFLGISIPVGNIGPLGIEVRRILLKLADRYEKQFMLMFWKCYGAKWLKRFAERAGLNPDLPCGILPFFHFEHSVLIQELCMIIT